MEVVNELFNGGFRLSEEPLDGLAGLVVAQHILKVEELPRNLEREPHPPVSDPLRRADLAVPVLLPGPTPPRLSNGGGGRVLLGRLLDLRLPGVGPGSDRWLGLVVVMGEEVVVLEEDLV